MASQKERSKSARIEIDLVSDSVNLTERLNALPRTQFVGNAKTFPQED